MIRQDTYIFKIIKLDIVQVLRQIPIPYTHYNDIKMNAIASQITGVSIVYSPICSGIDQRIH